MLLASSARVGAGGSRGLCAAGFGLLCALYASPSFAQETAAAAALFERGLQAMEAGRYKEGCPALEESYRIEPLAGVLFTSAECHAKWGKTATAVTRYRDYLRAFERMPESQRLKQGKRDEIAKKQIAALEAQVPKLAVSLPASAPAETVVKRGGVVLGRPSLGVAIPTDPGDHVFTTEVPGGPRHEQTITILPAETKTVELEVELPASGAGAPTTSAVATSRSPVADDAGSSQRTLAYIAGGIGIAGVVVGSVTGAMVFSKKSTVEGNCNDTQCNAEGKDAADSAQTLGLVSTIGFGVGVAGLATGVVLLLTAPKSETVEKHRFRPIVAAGERATYVGMAGSF